MTAHREDHAPRSRRVDRFNESLPPASQDDPAATLPDHITQNIEAVKAHHTRADETLSRYQRPLETVGTVLGRPAFFLAVSSLLPCGCSATFCPPSVA
jgi:hypothetical protein